MGSGAAAMVKRNLLEMNQWDTGLYMDLRTWHCQCAVHGLHSLAKDGRIHRLFVILGYLVWMPFFELSLCLFWNCVSCTL